MATVVTKETTLPADIIDWIDKHTDIQNPETLLADLSNHTLIAAVVSVKNPAFTIKYDMSPHMNLSKAYSLLALVCSRIDYIDKIDPNPMSEQELQLIAPVQENKPNVRWYYIWYSNPYFNYKNNVPGKIYEYTNHKYNNMVFWQTDLDPPFMTMRFWT